MSTLPAWKHLQWKRAIACYLVGVQPSFFSAGGGWARRMVGDTTLAET